ncbi:cupin [Mariprofundus erugo]|uniref:cupin domain-containing protein n=1 Tax=Mariprofundus erugo TaxID=2528639 RepID=UPI0010FE8D9C|nr:cupin [Mariprofundus erugo]
MLNMDFTKAVIINTHEMQWEPAPAAGVYRKKLEREFPESGRATSLVRYEAGAVFPEHEHPLGEEIFVLDGVFSDESGDYPAGTYLRHPAGSRHAPFSKEGCTIFVKVNHFRRGDNKVVSINTKESDWYQGYGNLRVMPLHEYEGESTALVNWPANEVFVPHRHHGGEEILVLSGVFMDEHGVYPGHTWLRSPHLSQHYPFVKEGALILVKVGHLHGA